MMHARSLLTGLGVGAGLMYYFDPRVGRSRRKLLSDQTFSTLRQIEDDFRISLRDLSNRSYGALTELRSAIGPHDDSDAVLCDRVRSKLGRHVSHSGAIDVTAENGRVTLSGPVLSHEVGELVAAVAAVRGVTGVDNRLEVHREAGHLSSLQGGRERPRDTQITWAPGTRMLAGAIGCVLMANCLARRTPGAVLLGTFGFGLALRSMTNASLGQLLETSGRRRAMGVRRAFTSTARETVATELEQAPSATEQADPGLPGGGKGRRDITPMTSVYPASGPLPPGDAKVQPMGTFGQGDRGPEGYYDSGSSEIISPERFAQEEEASKKPT